MTGHSLLYQIHYVDETVMQYVCHNHKARNVIFEVSNT